MDRHVGRHVLLSLCFCAAVATTPLAAQTAISTDGVIESTAGGFKFPDGTIQMEAVAPGRAGVPATGQTTCYDPSGTTTETVSCAGTGQDGDLQAGVPWPSPRFTDNLDGTVTDNLTALTWLKDANCPGVSPPMQYVDAVNAANGLASGACGLADGSVAGDWRLPNIRELLSLADFSQPGYSFFPLPAGHPFLNAEALGGAYWTSTHWKNHVTSVIQYSSAALSDASKGNSDLFWAVKGGLAVAAAAPPGAEAGVEVDAAISTDGVIESTEGGFVFPDGNTQAAPVTAAPAPAPDTGQVRCYSPVDNDNTEILCPGSGLDGEFQAGVDLPAPRFTDNGDGTVLDNLTGLVWLRDAYCDDLNLTDTFAASLSLAAGLASGTCGLSDGSIAGDWRMPNINEMLSLTDFAHPSAFPTRTLTPGHPFVNLGPDSYWTSTTFVEEAEKAYIWWGGDGITSHDDKNSEDHALWPVRGPE